MGKVDSKSGARAFRIDKRIVQLLLLALALWSAMYCRSALAVLQETMRVSLGFSDNQMALLQGAAMALPMALCSVPLGVLADRFSRARLLRVIVALMPLSCALSAVASQFVTLFLTRCLAGFCAAGVLILAFSMVGDLYLPHLRGRASMVLASAEILGAPASFAFGGWLLVTLGPIRGVSGWRWVLLVMAGLLLPVLMLMCWLREPVRRERRLEKPPLVVLWPRLWRYRAVALPILLARGMVWLADGAVFVWAAPSFSRRFHLPADRLGAIMGGVLLVSGLAGPALGGPLADYCQRHGGPRHTVRVMAGIASLSIPLAFFNFFPNVIAAAAVMAIFLVLGFMIATAGVSLSIIVIPGELRGSYLGVTFVVGSVFFVGLAPLAVSTLSAALGGAQMIGQALALVCAVASSIGGVVFALSSRFFPATLDSSDPSLAREGM